MVEYVLTQRFQEASLVIPPKLVDGHDLISIFGLTSGPLIGKLLRLVREAQATGKVRSKDDALALIRQNLDSECSNGHCDNTLVNLIK